jgi:hypothetical protein
MKTNELKKIIKECILESICWDGYERVPGTKKYEKGSCRKKINEVDTCMSAIFEIFNIQDNNIQEAEYQGRNVELNKPMQGDVKKFKVYVKDPKTGNVKKVNFGAKGMRIKKDNPERRKAFRARHNCDNPGPKTSAKYWSCKKW